MKGDQMGTGPTHPSPRELPLPNQTRFNLTDGVISSGESRGWARSGRGAQRPASAFHWTPTMTKEQKILRAKVGLLELAKQLGNVSQACKMMGYSRDSFYRFKDLYQPVDEVVVSSGRWSKAILKTIRAGMALWATRTVMRASYAPLPVGSRTKKHQPLATASFGVPAPT